MHLNFYIFSLFYIMNMLVTAPAKKIFKNISQVKVKTHFAVFKSLLLLTAPTPRKSIGSCGAPVKHAPKLIVLGTLILVRQNLIRLAHFFKLARISSFVWVILMGKLAI